MEACVGEHNLSRKLKALGHDARLMPAKHVRPYSKGQKNHFKDAEAIAEAVQRPTMKLVATNLPSSADSDDFVKKLFPNCGRSTVGRETSAFDCLLVSKTQDVERNIRSLLVG